MTAPYVVSPGADGTAPGHYGPGAYMLSSLETLAVPKLVGALASLSQPR